MDFDFTPEQQELKAAVIEFARGELAGGVDEAEKK
jgi:hypothetical protein